MQDMPYSVLVARFQMTAKLFDTDTLEFFLRLAWGGGGVHMRKGRGRGIGRGSEGGEEGEGGGERGIGRGRRARHGGGGAGSRCRPAHSHTLHRQAAAGLVGTRYHQATYIGGKQELYRVPQEPGKTRPEGSRVEHSRQ